MLYTKLSTAVILNKQKCYLYKCHSRLVFPSNYPQMASSLYQAKSSQVSKASYFKSQILIWASGSTFSVKNASTSSLEHMAFSQLLNYITNFRTLGAVQDGGT